MWGWSRESSLGSNADLSEMSFYSSTALTEELRIWGVKDHSKVYIQLLERQSQTTPALSQSSWKPKLV